MDLKVLVDQVIEDKMNDGSLKKIVETQVEECVEKALKEVLDGYHNGSMKNQITEKLEGVVNKVIEGYDFNQYVVKMTDILNKVAASSTMMDYKKLARNMNIAFDDVPEEIRTSDIFEKYKKLMQEKNFCSSDTDTWDFTDGEAELDIEMMTDEDTGELVFKFSDSVLEKEDDYNDYTCRISLGTNYKDQTVITNVTWSRQFGGAPMWSIKHMEPFAIYLLRLQQEGTVILVDEREMEDYITMEREYM